MKRLVLGVAMVWGLPAVWGQNFWGNDPRLVAQGEAVSIFLYPSVRRVGNTAFAWTLHTYSEPEVTQKRRYQSAQVFSRFDCLSGAESVLQLSLYEGPNAQGRVVSTDVFPSDDLPRYPIPGSLAERVYLAACATPAPK